MMKLRNIAALACFFVANFSFGQSYSEYRSVPTTAEVDNIGNSITLNWIVDADATEYQVFRRNFGSGSWGSVLSTLTATDSSFTDNTVKGNTVYEYDIRKKTAITDPTTNHTTDIVGHGYVTAAYDLDAVHSRGVMWILIADNLSSSLSTEIETLKSDLAGDGWDVYTEVINETAGVTDVKSFIDGQKASPKGLDAIYLLGHIPVPYSGTYCESASYPFPPDGHYELDANSHCGAWTADVYYGTNSTGWTDNDSISTAKAAKRPKNDNKIGDGKFDNNKLPNANTLQIGRVDMDSLSVFSESEIELTRKYLAKAHDFKMGITKPIMKAVIDNNFVGAPEGFASGARRDFTAHIGFENIVYGDLLGENDTDNLLLGYAAGAGWYPECNGVGNSGDFDTLSGAFFNQIFGSFFGDFDIENNYMRASLASEKNNLTCGWSGRPKWLSHSLAIGNTIGEVTMNTQNHGVTGFDDYEAGYYQSSPHVVLLGDPSLRTVMIDPSSGITLTANNDSSEVDISWTASPEQDITGYYVYVSHRPFGAFQLLNQDPIAGTSFNHSSPFDGTNWYMVRTEKMTTTSSGAYYNLSIGDRAEINGMKGDFAEVTLPIEVGIKVYPTLVQNELFVDRATNENSSFRIINQLGMEVLTGTLSDHKSPVSVSELTSGTYILRVGSQSFKFIKK